jgi:hypothetical protein
MFDPNSIFAWIEQSALSEWLRGSDCVCAFPAIVTLHNVGMTFLAGCGIAIDLRIVGFATGIPLKPMERLLPLMWLSFGISAVTGVLLLIAYPTKALTNPLFYIKLSIVVVALGLLYRIAGDVLGAAAVERKSSTKSTVLAIASLAAWIALIASGRYLAYSHRWEMLGVPAVL